MGWLGHPATNWRGVRSWQTLDVIEKIYQIVSELVFHLCCLVGIVRKRSGSAPTWFSIRGCCEHCLQFTFCPKGAATASFLCLLDMTTRQIKHLSSSETIA